MSKTSKELSFHWKKNHVGGQRVFLGIFFWFESVSMPLCVESTLYPLKMLLWAYSSKKTWSACVWNVILLEKLRTRALSNFKFNMQEFASFSFLNLEY